MFIHPKSALQMSFRLAL